MILLAVSPDPDEELYEVKCEKDFIRFFYRKKDLKRRIPIYEYSAIYSVQKGIWASLLEHSCPEDEDR